MVAEDVLSKYPAKREYLLMILHDIQNRNPRNYLPEEDLKKVAEYLNTTLASVYGVVGYYSMLSLRPRGRYVIRFCRSPVCECMGGREAFRTLSELLGVGNNETTPDGRFTLETSECLGLCDGAPAMMVNETPYEALDRDGMEAILQRYREQ